MTKVEGVPAVTRAGTQPQPLRFGDNVFDGDRIETDAQSRLLVLLGGKALATLREGSAVTIGAAPAVNSLDLTAGTLVLTIARDRMKVGEVVEVRTPDAIVRIRGTVVVAQVSLGSSRFTVLSGVADVVPFDAGSQPAVSLKLAAGLTLVVTKGIAPTEPRTLTELERAAFLMVGLLPAPRTRTLPEDWTLLVDHGNGFELWWGAAADGDVAGDGALERTSLAACDAVAGPLAREGARVACARLPWRESLRRVHHRDIEEHVLVRGPLAGKLVVYEPGADPSGWRLIPRRGDSWSGTIQYWGVDRPDVSSAPAVDLSACYEASVERQAACVRLPPSSSAAAYRDVRGRLMAEGPFAGDFVVYDRQRPPMR